MLGDLLAPDHASGVDGQKLQQRVLLGRQRQLVARARDAMRARVDAQVGRLDDRILPHAAAPQQRAQPRQQLRKFERLDEVVVGAGVESFHAIGQRIARRQHQDRRVIPLGAQHPADLESIRRRNARIEHDRVVRRGRSALQRLLAGRRDVHRIRLLAESRAR